MSGDTYVHSDGMWGLKEFNSEVEMIVPPSCPECWPNGWAHDGGRVNPESPCVKEREKP